MQSITKPTIQPRIDSSPILLLIFEFLEPPAARGPRPTQVATPPSGYTPALHRENRRPAVKTDGFSTKRSSKRTQNTLGVTRTTRLGQPYRRSPRPRRRAILAL